MKKIWIVIPILFWSVMAFGENFSSDNRGLSVLDMNTSPVSVSLGNGYSLLGNIITSFLDNPAMLAKTEDINIIFNHNELGFDMRRDDIYFSKRMSENLGIMMGIGYYNGGSIELRGVIPQDIPYSTTNFSDFIAGVGAGYSVYNELKIGFECKFVSQYSYIYSGVGLSFDAGVLFSPGILRGIAVSAVFNNFGPSMQFGETESVSQPSRMRFAVGKQFQLRNIKSELGVSLGGYSKYYVSSNSNSNLSFLQNVKNFFNTIPDKAVTDIDFDYMYDNMINLRLSYLIGGENTVASIGMGTRIRRFMFNYSYTIEKTTGGIHRMNIGVNY